MAKKQLTLTRSKDSVMRVSTKVELRFSLQEMATYITAGNGNDLLDDEAQAEHDIQPDQAKIKRLVTSRRKAIELAVEEVLADGMQIPSYKVGDNDWESIETAVLDHLTRLWAE